MKDSVSPYQPRKYLSDIFKGQFVSITGGLLAGIILASWLRHLEILPGFFILLPGFLELHGDVNTTLAARIGSLVHTKGVDKIDEVKDVKTKTNFWAAFFLSLLASLVLGIFVFFITWIFFGQINLRLVLISCLSGLLVSLILIPLTLIVSTWLYKKGYDPDNVMGPFLTSLTDIVSVIILILVMKGLK